MIDSISEPMAWADVAWFTAEEGGRKSGPPTAKVYAATCVFPLGDDIDVQPGWPAAGDAFSILLEAVDTAPDGSGMYKVDFLVRDLVRPFLCRGADVLVMEGPSVVARAVVLNVARPPVPEDS